MHPDAQILDFRKSKIFINLFTRNNFFCRIGFKKTLVVYMNVCFVKECRLIVFHQQKLANIIIQRKHITNNSAGVDAASTGNEHLLVLEM